MDLKITPSGQTIVKPTALGPGANTDTKLLIYGLFQKGRVLAQDGVPSVQFTAAANRPRLRSTAPALDLTAFKTVSYRASSPGTTIGSHVPSREQDSSQG